MTSAQAAALLFDLSLILALCHAFGRLARFLAQPAVVGEIIAGILLGPTLFDGRLAATLFPTDVRPMLSALANVGIALFMFQMGMELDHRLVRAQGRVVSWVSAGSLLVPFGLGVGLALWLQPGHVRFALFLGTAMAVTAFPVLARIVSERRLDGTRVGGIALASAAVGDVVAWTMLACVVAAGGPPWGLLLAIPYLVLMGTVVRRLLRHPRLLRAGGRLNPAVILFGVLVSGGLTELIGWHFIFGAFLFGLVMPRDLDGAEELRANVNGALGRQAVLFLPVYFVIAGLKVDLSGLGRSGLLVFGLVLLAAMGGKVVGVYTTARIGRLDPRSAGRLAALMNARGLTELVLLTIGLQAGLLDTRLYSLMVAMAVLTTVLAGPLLHLFDRRDGKPEQIPSPARAGLDQAPSELPNKVA